MSALQLETRAEKYELEITIDAPAEVVWKSLTREVDAWWLADFRMVGEGSVVTFDARAGGQLIEAKEDGGSLLWYTVTLVQPGECLHLVGHLAPDWGGPATTMLHLALAEEGGKTTLTVKDALFGALGDTTASSLKEGWQQLFGEGLKKHVEA